MKIIPIILICFFFSFLVVNCMAQAFVFQTEKSVEYDTKKGLTESAKGIFDTSASVDEQTPAKVIGRLLTYLLTFLGIVFLIIVLIGGVTWMTAGGDSAKTEKALKWIINGVIGLIIALAAFVIVNFVMNTAIEIGTPMPTPEELKP